MRDAGYLMPGAMVSRVEDYLSGMDFTDMTVALGAAALVGSHELTRQNPSVISAEQEIKSDGSTVGKLDKASGRAMANYLNSTPVPDYCRFRSEEGMQFRQPHSYDFAGILDDLDGSVNPLIGGTNMLYIGVGGVIHRRKDDTQTAAAAVLPFDSAGHLYIAESERGTHRVEIYPEFISRRIELTGEKAQKNTLIESGWMTDSTLDAERRLQESRFYISLGMPTAKDRATAGIFQTVSGVRDSRQVVLNYAPSHQADYCWLLLEEAGADVIGQDGRPMHSGSYAMLSAAPSFSGDREELKGRFVDALHDYQGWSPGKVVMKSLFE